MKELTVDHTWTEMVTVDGAPVEREREVHLVIGGPSNLRMGMERSLLIEEQRILWEVEKNRLVDQGVPIIELTAAQLLRTQMFPSMIAGVIRQEGFDLWPITYSEFEELPEELGMKWEEAVGELNPHWLPQIEPETREELEEARKKAMNGTSEPSIG